VSKRLAGKAATIPGSTTGIGRAYVREGARVVVNSRSAAAAVITGEVLTVDGGWSPYGHV